MAGENSPMQEFVNALRAGEYIKTTGIWDIVLNSFNFAGEEAIGADDFVPALFYVLNETDFKLEDVTALNCARTKMKSPACKVAAEYTNILVAAELLFTYRNQLMQENPKWDSKQVQSAITKQLDICKISAQTAQCSITKFLDKGCQIKETTPRAVVPENTESQEVIAAVDVFYKKNEAVIDENIIQLNDHTFYSEEINAVRSGFETEFKGQKNTPKLQAKLNDRLNKKREELDKARPERLLQMQKEILVNKIEVYILFLDAEPKKRKTLRARRDAAYELYKCAKSDETNLDTLVNEIDKQLKVIEENKPGWREGAFINAIVNLVNHFRSNKRTTAFAVKAAETDHIISSLNDFSAVDANDKVQSSAGAEFDENKGAGNTVGAETQTSTEQDCSNRGDQVGAQEGPVDEEDDYLDCDDCDEGGPEADQYFRP